MEWTVAKTLLETPNGLIQFVLTYSLVAVSVNSSGYRYFIS